jgi:hypothetical protein
LTSEPKIGIIIFLFLLASWSPSVPYGMLLDFRECNWYNQISVSAG